jgi:hypothetical protein
VPGPNLLGHVVNASDSRMPMPPFVSAPSVRAKRPTEILRITPPRTGKWRTNQSHRSRPCSPCFHRLKQNQPPIKPTSKNGP